MSSIPGRCTIGQLVLGWVTVFKRAYHLGRQPATQANSASYPAGREMNTDQSAVMCCGWGVKAEWFNRLYRVNGDYIFI